MGAQVGQVARVVAEMLAGAGLGALVVGAAAGLQLVTERCTRWVERRRAVRGEEWRGVGRGFDALAADSPRRLLCLVGERPGWW